MFELVPLGLRHQDTVWSRAEDEGVVGGRVVITSSF